MNRFSRLNIKIIFLFFVFVNSAYAEHDLYKAINPDEYEKYDGLQLGDDNSGTYDPATGAFTFSATDISIPGNFNLPVELRRWIPNDDMDTGGPGDWKWDIPFIRMYYMDRSARASNTSDSPTGGVYNGYNCTGSYPQGQHGYPVGGNWNYIEPSAYWDGKLLHIPGGATEKFLNGSKVDDPDFHDKQITKSGAYISGCTDAGNGEEGVVVTTSNGNKYFFEQIKKYDSGTYTGVNFNPWAKFTKILMVKKVEDRFGNFVEYQYDSVGNLSKIHSSDSRQIEIHYSNGKVERAVANGKTWWYNQKDNTFEVVLPEGKKWQYPKSLNFYSPTLSLNLANRHPTTRAHSAGACNIDPNHPNAPTTKTIITPDGLKISYDFKRIYHGRASVDADTLLVSEVAIGGINNTITSRNLDCTVKVNLVKRVIEGPSISPLTWFYNYSQNAGFYNRAVDARVPSTGLIPAITPNTLSLPVGGFPSNITDTKNFKTTTIVGPDSTIIHYIDRLSTSFSEGNVAATDIVENGFLTKRTLFEYAQGARYGETWYEGGSIYSPKDTLNRNSIEYFVNVKSKVDVLYEKNGVSTSYSIEFLNYDKFGKYGISKEFNDFSDSISYSRLSYLNLTDFWLLSLPISKEISFDGINWIPLNKIIYHPTSGGYKGLPYINYRFGKVYSRNEEYFPDGNLKLVKFEDSNLYQLYGDYYRGQAREITMPCAADNGCDLANNSSSNTIIARFEVNPDGKVVSLTDFVGHKRTYSYNELGWLIKIDYADPKWADKVISYTVVNSAGDGISGSDVAVGSLRQTISQGNYEKRIYHDGLLRSILTQERDISNPSTTRYQSFAYDHDNRQTLASFLSADASNRIGMETEYDALGRVITQTRTSDGSVSRREYLSGNKVAVTDGENNTTTTTYLAYGEPSFDHPTLIEAPDTDDVAIDYNIFGQVTSIRQGSVTETRIYDAYQQLCKQVRPETGISAFGYNGQRQQIWRAEGTNGSTTACDASAVPATHKVLLSYDNLGQLRTENFPDTTPDKTYSYDANGNLTTLLAGSVNWTYLYNSLNTLEKETLALDGKDFVLDWEYNNLGGLSSLKSPSGAIVDFAPNALGQATKAGSYASGVSYHPNGQIKQFTYGNGIIRNVALDTTGRIDALTDIKAGSVKNSLDPSYDYNDNLARLIDWVDRNNDVDNLTYDGVDRLKSADGKWGAGSYNYDGLGNVLSRNLNNSTINYNYNTTLNRLNNLTGAYAYGYQYDTRGNVTNNGRYSLDYNLGQQMTAAKGISYVYDGNNKRVKQTKTDGSHYTVYSQGGQLLYREAANGTKTDSVYLGKQLVAEVDNALFVGTPPVISLNVQWVLSGSPCPPKMQCPEVLNTWVHKVTWSSANTTSCLGTVDKSVNGVYRGSESLSGINGNHLYAGDGTVYQITLTCSGDGGQKTVQAIASGIGGGSDM